MCVENSCENIRDRRIMFLKIILETKIFFLFFLMFTQSE